MSQQAFEKIAAGLAELSLDPSGERDSTDALQRLLDLGGELPPGTYRISRALWLAKTREEVKCNSST